MSTVTRVEVIDPEGRVFTKYYDVGMEARAVLQDDNRTLKVFLDIVEEEV